MQETELDAKLRHKKAKKKKRDEAISEFSHDTSMDAGCSYRFMPFPNLTCLILEEQFYYFEAKDAESSLYV